VWFLGNQDNLSQLTGNTGIAVTDSNQNINIIGATGQIDVTGSGSTLTISLTGGSAAIDSFAPDTGTNPVVPTAGGLVTLSGGTNMQTVGSLNSVTFNATNFHTSRYIVSAGGAADGANYTTISSAYAAALSAGAPQTVFVQPGTYTENITLSPGINISAYSCDPWGSGVSIVGKLSYSSDGTVSISGVNLQTNSDYFLEVTGSVASKVFLSHCNLSMSNNVGIHYTSSSGSSGIFIDWCRGDLATTNIALFTQTSSGQLKLNYTIITNTGGSSTSSTNSGAGNTGLFYSYLANPITTSSTALFGSQFSEMDTVGQNTTTLTLNGSGANFIEYSKFGSGSASAISVGSGVTANFSNCEVNSSNANAITGLGTVNLGIITFIGSSSTINTSTVNKFTTYGGTII
jgi:hypothetical protein